MKIKIAQTFGRRRVMGSAKILPGVYEANDPALFGLADELLAEGYAVPVADETATAIILPVEPIGEPVGPTHEQFEEVTGRRQVTDEDEGEAPEDALPPEDTQDDAPPEDAPPAEDEAPVGESAPPTPVDETPAPNPTPRRGGRGK